MRLQLMIFLALMVSPALSDTQQKEISGYDPKVDVIAENYEAGAYLIYDCEEKHWTCVLESYYKACQDSRAEDLKLNKTSVRCAPFGSYPTKKSCFQHQLFMVSHNHGTRFCVGDVVKQKEINF